MILRMQPSRQQEYRFDSSFGRKNCLYAAYQHDSGDNGKEDTHKAFSDKTGNPLVNVGAFHEKKMAPQPMKKRIINATNRTARGEMPERFVFF